MLWRTVSGLDLEYVAQLFNRLEHEAEETMGMIVIRSLETPSLGFTISNELGILCIVLTSTRHRKAISAHLYECFSLVL